MTSLKKATPLFTPNNKLLLFLSCLSKNEGSMVMFGGVDNSYFSGNLSWVPVSKPSYWQISMDR